MDIKDQKLYGYDLKTLFKAVYGSSLKDIPNLNKEKYQESKNELATNFKAIDDCVYNILLEATLRHNNVRYCFYSGKDITEKLGEQDNGWSVLAVSICDEKFNPLSNYVVDYFGNITKVKKFKQKNNEECQSQL